MRFQLHVVSKYCGKNKGTQKNFYSFYIFKDMFSSGGLHQYFTHSLKNSENRFCKTKFSSRTCCSKSITMKLRCSQCKRKHLAAGGHDILVSMILVRSNTWMVFWMTREWCLKVLWHFHHYSQIYGLTVLANFPLQITNTVFIPFSHKHFAKVVEADIF